MTPPLTLQQAANEIVALAQQANGPKRWASLELAVKDILVRLPSAPQEPPQALEHLAKEAQAIYDGFRLESLNGVVCSIPDEGLDTRPHREWCARCQDRYRRLKALAADITEVLAKMRELESEPAQSRLSASALVERVEAELRLCEANLATCEHKLHAAPTGEKL